MHPLIAEPERRKINFKSLTEIEARRSMLNPLNTE
jgi:hypothetical protein